MPPYGGNTRLTDDDLSDIVVVPPYASVANRVGNSGRAPLDRSRLRGFVPDAALEILLDRRRGDTPGAHGEDHRCAAGDDVAAGEHSRHRGAPRGSSSTRSVPQRVCSSAGSAPSNSGFGALPMATIATSTGRRRCRPRSGPDVAVRSHPARRGSMRLETTSGRADRVVAEEFDWGDEIVEDGRPPPSRDALPRPCRHLCCGSAVDDSRLCCAEAECGADAIHGRVAAAEHRNPPAGNIEHGGVGVRHPRLHEVDTREELVRRVDTDEMFARDAEEARQPGADPDEHRVESLCRRGAPRG